MASKKTFVSVEFDRQYTGGDYSGCGERVLLPSECAKSDEQLHKAFEKKTGLSPVHIVGYCPDELFDGDGNPLGQETLENPSPKLLLVDLYGDGDVLRIVEDTPGNRAAILEWDEQGAPMDFTSFCKDKGIQEIEFESLVLRNT